MQLARRVKEIKPSPTLAVDAKAKALLAQGIDVVGFGAGEPDFDTPDNIKEAAIKAIKSGFTKYTPAGGTEELKKAVCQKFQAGQQPGLHAPGDSHLLRGKALAL